jgi:nucleoid-associated protein YgaU
MPRQSIINYQQLTINAIKLKYSSFILGFILVIFSSLILLESISNKYLIIPKKIVKKTGSVLSQNQKVKTYTVTEGDDLWKISEKVYGSGFNGYDIALYNNISDPYVLSAGQVLKIPLITPKQATVGETSSAATSQVTFKGSKYTIQAGDDLGIIAQKVYGDPNMWQKIVRANNLSDPNILIEGTTLNIPR